MTGTPSQTRQNQTKGVPYSSFQWSDAFELIEPRLSRALVPEDECTRVARFSSEIPADWHWGILEIRLGKEDVPVDVLAAMRHLDDARDSLRGALRGPFLDSLGPTGSTLKNWVANDGTAFSNSPTMWMEWDRHGYSGNPLAWACLAPHFYDRNLAQPSPAEVALLGHQLMQSDERLMVEGSAQVLESIAHALPTNGQMMGFASLKPRGAPRCRAFARLPQGKVGEWLKAINWNGDWDQFNGLGTLFQSEGEYDWCQVEFGDNIEPYLALELAQTERGFRNRRSREAWFDEIVARGWATREKADAVLSWPKSEACELPHGEKVTLERSFHVKLVLHPSRPPEAKAYLGFYFRRQN